MLPNYHRILTAPIPRILLYEMARKGYVQHPNTLGQHIRKKRLDLGLSQKRLAEMLGVAQPTVQHWEDYGEHPKAKNMERIQKFLGFSPSELPLA